MDSAIEQQVREYEGPVFSMIGGAAHVLVGLAVHPRRFDFVLPAEPSLPLDEAAEVLPSLAVQRILESEMSESLALMGQVRRLTAGPVFHIEPPPPSADAERMQGDIPWVLFPGRCHAVSPVSLRYKLWRLHSQILSGWCAEAGVDLVPAPPETIDAAGTLRDPYYGDGVHANAKYGALVLKQMRQLA